MNEKEMLQDLIYQHSTLKLKVEALERRLEDYKHKIQVLNKMTDEWAKSYDSLLKDFISYRDRSNR